MDEVSTERPAEAALFAGEAWFDPIEAGLRERIRHFIEELARAGADRGPGSAAPRPRPLPGAPARPSGAAADWLLRAGRDQRAAGPAARRGWRHPRVAQRHPA